MPLQGVDFWGNRTRRDAAGWYVLPFQGERITVTIDLAHKRKTLPISILCHFVNDYIVLSCLPPSSLT
ncbi:MAG: hypothetical protein LBG58_06885 [Planctomycetaceae bacterium]|nr:hypothetical protein [Planctomycetaceae bacterium]